MITVLLGMVLLVCSVLSGCQAATSDAPTASGPHATSTAGQVALAVPVELRQVLGSAPCTQQTPSPATTSTTSATEAGAVVAKPVSTAPTTMHDVDGVDCYQVTVPLMALQQLDTISVTSQPPATQWVIAMTMTSADAQSFAALTAERTQQQLAFVVRGTVLATQTIAAPVTNGVVQLQGNFTQDDATRLIRQITG
jgi:preprotein translocase subunit SecD